MSRVTGSILTRKRFAAIGCAVGIVTLVLWAVFPFLNDGMARAELRRRGWKIDSNVSISDTCVQHYGRIAKDEARLVSRLYAVTYVIVGGEDFQNADLDLLMNNPNVYKQVWMISISGAPLVTSISSVSQCEQLSSLSLIDCGALSDLDPIAAMKPLPYVRISGKTAIKTIPPALVSNSHVSP